MKLSQMEENIRRERKRQIVLTVIAVMAALLFGVMVLPVWGRIDGYLLHPSAWSVTAAVFFLCNAVSLARRTWQHKPERSMHIILTCVAVLLTLFFGVSLVEGLLGIPPLFPNP